MYIDTFVVSGGRVRQLFNLCVGGLIAYLSVPIVQNLMSSRQIMNTSFDSFRLVNTYGAFGRYYICCKGRKHEHQLHVREHCINTRCLDFTDLLRAIAFKRV